MILTDIVESSMAVMIYLESLKSLIKFNSIENPETK